VSLLAYCKFFISRKGAKGSQRRKEPFAAFDLILAALRETAAKVVII
jgi:hypothetical protein